MIDVKGLDFSYNKSNRVLEQIGEIPGVKAVAIFPRSCYNDREATFLHEGGVSNG